MSKLHILSAFLMLTAWSGNFVASSAPTATNWQIGAPAEAGVRWTPNPDRGSASSTLSGGRRGTAASACALDAEEPDPAITLLVPEGTIGLTTKAHPTLSWYLESESIVDMEFVLSHPDRPEPVFTKQLQSDTGLVEVALPEDVALETGTMYRWTVFVTCNGGEYEIHARSFVERIEDSGIDDSMASMSPSERATDYAARGIWYDALNTLVSSYREDARLVTLLDIRDLLQQADTQVPLELSLAVETQN